MSESVALAAMQVSFMRSDIGDELRQIRGSQRGSSGGRGEKSNGCQKALTG
ncbi:hypothetical protein Pd630_LPD16053 (plasmid) [Rhodococcus opacus PD630]|nr:hypothetical protein Pd630_LPD16053 [Rhodococcus opacus PD630]